MRTWRTSPVEEEQWRENSASEDSASRKMEHSQHLYPREMDLSELPPLTPKKSSSFSIDNILGSSRQTAESSSAKERFELCRSEYYREASDCTRDPRNIPHQTDASSRADDHFSWLQYNRYRPPKLARRRDSRRRRHVGRSPRIPFSGSQVAILEEKFRQTRYLSSLEVAQLSQLLSLTDSRVKIWFQNRRARERRENQVNSLPLQEPIDLHRTLHPSTMPNCYSYSSTRSVPKMFPPFLPKTFPPSLPKLFPPSLPMLCDVRAPGSSEFSFFPTHNKSFASN